MIDASAVSWSYFNPVKVISGTGSLDCLPKLLSDNGTVLLVTTEGFTRRGLTKRICDLLGKERVRVCDSITPNPELDYLDALCLVYRHNLPTSIVALGGGSVLDAAKVLGIILVSKLLNPLSEQFRKGNAQDWKAGLPVIAIPTTSGTGAEVTPFATIWDSAHNKKYSLSNDHVFPSYALLDPELTVTMPRQETLFTGLDAVSHALESLWNKNRSAVTEVYAMQALDLANKSLPVVLEYPANIQQRIDMQKASLLAGLAISQTRTAIAHSISYPMTLHFGVPHGLACSFTLVKLIELYYESLNDDCYEKIIIQSTHDMLLSLRLDREIAMYLDADNALKYLAEMFHPERMLNYTGVLDTFIVGDIVKSSIAYRNG